jgi:hypothetical protein
MTIIHCGCGEVFSDAEFPSQNTFYLISDVLIEDLTASIIRAVEAGEDVESRVGFLLMSTGVRTYQCPNCERLLVFWDGLDHPARSYKPESDQ